MDNSRYIEYVNSHIEEISEYVDEHFEQAKDFIKAKLICQIRKYLSPISVHYDLKSDNDPYDCSGILVESGYISLNQTVKEFLQNEYSGIKEATYISGRSWSYNTYEDELHYYTIDIAANIMFPAIQRYIENQFDITISDDEFEDIQSSCGEFDEIYDNCMASDFFFGYPAIEFVGIENIQLNNIIKKEKG